MFNNLNKKIITAITAFSLALSSISAVPALALAKDNDNDDHGKGKNNFGQSVKNWAHFKNYGEGEGLKLGLKGLGSIDSLSTISPSSVEIFKHEMKDARDQKKESYKEAKDTLKIDLKAADNQEEKKSAVKTFLNNILSAFQAFAAAKEAALSKLISSL